jgi:hypothetical protein
MVPLVTRGGQADQRAPKTPSIWALGECAYLRAYFPAGRDVRWPLCAELCIVDGVKVVLLSHCGGWFWRAAGGGGGILSLVPCVP